MEKVAPYTSTCEAGGEAKQDCSESGGNSAASGASAWKGPPGTFWVIEVLSPLIRALIHEGFHLSKDVIWNISNLCVLLCITHNSINKSPGENSP
jgi:hypothetical protein